MLLLASFCSKALEPDVRKIYIWSMYCTENINLNLPGGTPLDFYSPQILSKRKKSKPDNLMTSNGTHCSSHEHVNQTWT